MRKFYQGVFTVLISSFVINIASAQKNSYWTSTTFNRKAIVTDKAVSRLSFPKSFELFDLSLEPLKQELFRVVGNAQSHTTIISLPNIKGQLEQFEVVEASNFEPALQTRFPEIRAFSGKGITDKAATLKMSLSPQGIQTMIFRADSENEFIEPYSRDHHTYAVFKTQRDKGSLSWACFTPEADAVHGINEIVQKTANMARSGGDLKTIRLAQSCNAEYSNYFGATSAAQVDLVLAAFNATLTRCNGVYEKDLALHLNLIDATTNVIYYNPSTDPYTGMGSWNNQLQTTLTSVIGEANYDIGHMFGASGGGGNAGCIGCVCVNGSKGRGITSPADGIPQGDNFDIDYVVHEVGHQLGANHTFSYSLEGTGVNKEVGSGITIMGYAGITNYDVAPHSIDIFHEASIAQIQSNLANKTCPVTTTIVNSTPIVNAVSNYIIPISTPFALTGSATDADAGDVLTYCWEENDNSSVSGGNSVASATKTNGPNWISFSPTTSPTRYCPKLATILAGGLISNALPGGDAVAKTEALSSVNRTLNFRLTVRDNAVYSSTTPYSVGQTQFTDMVVTVTNTSGPFKVTIPNSALTWTGSTTQNVTWDVASTTGAPVSCANVKISLSTDGGFTFPIILAESTPNDGNEDVLLPGIATTTARIKVEAVGNIFFDISNSNFTITAPTSGFLLSSPAPANITCGTGINSDIIINTTQIGSFNTPISFSATGAPAGTTVVFNSDIVAPGQPTTATLSPVSTLAPGSYSVVVTGTAGTTIQTTTLTWIVAGGATPTMSTQPTSLTVCEGTAATFTASGTGAVTYQWQVNTGSGFNNIEGATSESYTISSASASQNDYQYQVLVSGQCGATTSQVAILTVPSLAQINMQPASLSSCEGSSASFSVGATGTNLTYQWQISTTDCNGNFTDITGANSSSYSLPAVTTAMNGYTYRAVVSGNGTCASSVASNCAALTVNVPLTITIQPQDASVCLPINTANFSVDATGTGLSYQWQLSTDGGANYNDISGANNSSLTVNNINTSFNNYKYRVVVNGDCSSATNSEAATMLVNSNVNITTQPQQSGSVCDQGSAILVVEATGSALTYQWQSSADGVSFTDIIDGGIYSGATTSNLHISPISESMNGMHYRVYITGAPCGAVTSNDILLQVDGLPVVTLTSTTNQGINPSSTVTLTATVSPPGSYTYAWYNNGILDPSRTGNSTIVNVDALGSWTVEAISQNSCKAASSAVEVKSSVSNNLFMYPNPNGGRFVVRFYSSNLNAARTLTVYDNKGSRVYQKKFNITSPYTGMQVDLINSASGVYIVDLRDASGKRLASGKVIVE